MGFAYSIFPCNSAFPFFSLQSMSISANSDVLWSQYPCDTDKRRCHAPKMVDGYSSSSEYLPTRSCTSPSEQGEVFIGMEDGQTLKQPECGERQNIAVHMMIIISILVDIYLVDAYYYWWKWGLLLISLYISMSVHREQ